MAAQHSARRQVGIFGGAFNPPHLGHLVVAQEAAACLRLDEVLFIPSGQPPDKPPDSLAAAAHRVAMVRAAIAGDTRFALSTVEVDRPGPSYTVDTLTYLLAASDPSLDVWLIVGGDRVLDLPGWHDAAGIARQVAGIVAVDRPGYDLNQESLASFERELPGVSAKIRVVHAPHIGVTSTLVRSRVLDGLPIRYLVPDAVADYIAAHDLYGARRHDADVRQHPPLEGR